MPAATEHRPKCYRCKHRGDCPSDTHSCCKYPGNDTGMLGILDRKSIENARKLHIQGDPYGVKMGWFMWPVNFDPAWLRNCDGFEEGST